LSAHLVQRWRRRGQTSHVELATTYGNRDKRAARNSALYSRASKPSGQPCCHFELRFSSAKACKRAGVGDFDSLINGVDALALLQHQTRIAFIDLRAVDRLAETFARNSKRRYPNTSLAEITKRVLDLLIRRLADDNGTILISRVRAQAFYDLGRCWRTCLREEVAWESFTPLPRWHHWRSRG
jgi:hypothetical protein